MQLQEHSNSLYHIKTQTKSRLWCNSCVVTVLKKPTNLQGIHTTDHIANYNNLITQMTEIKTFQLLYNISWRVVAIPAPVHSDTLQVPVTSDNNMQTLPKEKYDAYTDSVLLSNTDPHRTHMHWETRNLIRYSRRMPTYPPSCLQFTCTHWTNLESAPLEMQINKVTGSVTAREKGHVKSFKCISKTIYL